MSEDTEILNRALWVCQQMNTLHAISYDMGKVETLTEPGSLPAHVIQATNIIEQAERVASEIGNRKPRGII